MTIRFCKTHHCEELDRLIARSWRDNVLLILCPPMLRDFSFRSALPVAELEFFGDWSSSEKEQLAALPGDSEFRSDLILGVFTSGTTSQSSRLVLYTKTNLEASIHAIYEMQRDLKIGKIFCFPQAFHTFGLSLGYVASYLLGLKLITPDAKYNSTSLDRRLELPYQDVLTLGTPTHFYDLLKRAKERGLALAPSKAAIVGGAIVTRKLWTQIQTELGIEAPSVGYGCTEASPGITHLAPGVCPSVDGDIGLPLKSLKAEVLSEQGVRISGASLCSSIIQNAQAETAASLVINDRVSVLPNGHWVFQGRLDLLLNRGGSKYSLEQIEFQLNGKLGTQIVAMARPDDRLGQDLALVIPSQSSEQVQNQIAQLIKDEFGFKLKPENCFRLNEWPLNESAKLDRKKLALILKEA